MKTTDVSVYRQWYDYAAVGLTQDQRDILDAMKLAGNPDLTEALDGVRQGALHSFIVELEQAMNDMYPPHALQLMQTIKALVRGYDTPPPQEITNDPD